MKKLLIVVPVYNEEKDLNFFINNWANLLPENKMDLLFIDDGSKDNSVNIIKTYKKKIKNILLIEKINSGHGDTITKGYEFAIQNSYEYVFQVDSDNQFRSSDFKLLWSDQKKEYDLILGNRKIRKDSFLRVFLSKVILRTIIFLLFSKNIEDSNIPFRLIRVDFLKNYSKKLNFLPIAPNILMSIYSKKLQTIDIKHFERKYGEIDWSIKKLFKFGLKLIYDLIKFKNILNKE